jgi:hypothetical protein
MNAGTHPGILRNTGQPQLDTPVSLGGARTYSSSVLGSLYYCSTASTSSTTLVDAINVSGSGVVEFLAHTNSGAGTGVYVEVWCRVTSWELRPRVPKP